MYGESLTLLGLFSQLQLCQAVPGICHWMEGLPRPGAGKAEWEEGWPAAHLREVSTHLTFLPARTTQQARYQYVDNTAGAQARTFNGGKLALWPETFGQPPSKTDPHQDPMPHSSLTAPQSTAAGSQGEGRFFTG